MSKITSFIDEAIAELKNVEWPQKKDAARLTSYVILASIFCGIFVTGIDSAFAKGLGELLVRFGAK